MSCREQNLALEHISNFNWSSNSFLRASPPSRRRQPQKFEPAKYKNDAMLQTAQQQQVALERYTDCENNEDKNWQTNRAKYSLKKF